VSAAPARGPLVRRCAAALTWLTWWCALYGLWFLFSGQGGGPVAAAGAAAAAVGVVAARLESVRGLAAGRPNVRWAASLPGAARQTVVDFGIVTAVLARSITHGRRGPVGRFVRRGITPGRSAAAPALSWLALTASYSPNAYVIDIDPGRGQVVVHDLRPSRASEEPV
jgi:hypothetical protein